MTVEPDEVRMAAWTAFLRAHRLLIDRMEHELIAAHDLPLTWYDVLLNLHAAGGRLRMQELARSIVLSKSGLTRLVDRMVAAGLVERKQCESDRRGTNAVITDAGRARLREAAPTHLRSIETHFGSQVSEAEAADLRALFERLLRALS